MIMKSKAMTWAWILMLIQGFVMLIFKQKKNIVGRQTFHIKFYGGM